MKFGLFISARQIIRNKRKSIPLCLCMFLALSVLIDMMGIYKSYNQMLLEDTVENYGAYYCYMKNVTDKEYHLLSKNPYVERIGIENQMEVEELLEYDGKIIEEKQQIELSSMDKDAFELNKFRLRSGRLPETDGEIIVSAGMKVAGGYAYSVIEEGKKIETMSDDGQKKTYTVVGVMDNFNASQTEDKYKAYVTGCDGVCLTKNVYITLYEKGNIEEQLKDIFDVCGIMEYKIWWNGNRIIDTGDVLEEYHVICNRPLLDIVNDGKINESDRAVLYIMGIIVAFILIVATMIIWNIYSIILRERQSELGLLKICGVSTYQVLFAEWLESGILFALALILSVVFAGSQEILLQQVIQFLRISALTGLKVNISYELVFFAAVFVGVIVFGIVTLITMSVLKGTTPLMLLNGERESRNYRKKIIRRHSSYHMGVGFLIGKRNMLRNMGKTISIVAALLVITLFFVTFSSLIEVLESKVVTDVTVIPESQYTVFKDGDAFSKEFIDSIPDTEFKYTASLSRALFNISPDKKNEELKEYYNLYWYGHTADEVFGWDEWNLEVCGIGKRAYEEYIEWFDGDKPEYEEWVKSGKALIDDIFVVTDKDGNKSYVNQLNINPVDYVMTYNDYDDEVLGQTYEAGKVTLGARVGYKLDFREDNAIYLMVILPEEKVRNQFQAKEQILYLNAKRGKETELGAWLRMNAAANNYSVLDEVKKYAAAYDSGLTTKVILRFSFLFVVIVSILHIYNVVSSNLNARKKEMAVLMALGMKRWQIRKSVLWEHALYGIIGGILGAAASAVLLERLLKLLSGATKIKFVLPWDYMWVGLCSAIVVSMAVALYATRNVAKAGIVKEISAND